MNSLSRRALCALGAWLGSSVASAGCSATGCTGLVERVVGHESGATQVIIAGDKSAVDCTAPGGVYFTVASSSPGGRTIVAMVLTAQTTGREIFLRVVTGSADCKVGYAWMQ